MKYGIGITGPAKHGKTTTGNLLAELITEYRSSLHVSVIGLADALKDECSTSTGIPRSWFDDPEKKEFLRPLMQSWGDVRKVEQVNGNPLYWCSRVLEKAQLYSAEVLIVPDIRYDFEAQWLKSICDNCVMLEIQAPGAETTKHSGHSSEAGVSESLIDMVITNEHKGLPAYKELLKHSFDFRHLDSL